MTSFTDTPAGTAAADSGDDSLAETVGTLRKTFAAGRTKPLGWRLSQLQGISAC